jgi:predicted Zn-ribbon and HTH transcriptional regulator
MNTKELVINTLQESGKPLVYAEIAAIAGIEKFEVDKMIKTLKKEEKIISPKVCYYHVK